MEPRPFVRQEVFDFVIDFLRMQGVPSQTVNGTCAYRGEKGRMCAVGCLLPDEAITDDINGLSVNTSAVQRELAKVYSDFHEPDFSDTGEKYFESNLYFLDRLQWLHDTCLGKEFFESEVRVIAKRFDLTYRAPSGALSNGEQE